MRKIVVKKKDKAPLTPKTPNKCVKSDLQEEPSKMHMESLSKADVKDEA